LTPRLARPDLRNRKTRAIVDAAAKGTIYEYFRSKEELFLAVFEAFGIGTLDAVVARLQPRPASAVAFLRKFAETTLATCQDALYLYPLTMEFWAAAATSEFRDRLMQEFRKLYTGYRGVIADAIREGIASGEFGPHVGPEQIAAALVGAIDALFLQAWFDPGFDAVAAGTHFVEVTLRGMAAGPPARAKIVTHGKGGRKP
jgi:AcrR family transcriptional regulator